MPCYNIHVKHTTSNQQLLEKDVQIFAENDKQAEVKMTEMLQDASPQGLLSGYDGGTSTHSIIRLK
jgi:hypothetical protein